MKSFVKIGNTEYEPKSVRFIEKDRRYDMADSVEICLAMTYEEVKSLFSDLDRWAVIDRFPEFKGIEETVHDMSGYEICCCITDTMDGYCTVKMRKASYGEILAVLAGN